MKPTCKPGWEIPGGYLRAGETPSDGAAREVKEELDSIRRRPGGDERVRLPRHRSTRLTPHPAPCRSRPRRLRRKGAVRDGLPGARSNPPVWSGTEVT
ncbi:NUDIX domain-containing protein [Kitasatospora sp. NPDC048407]|uniref:NUDIX domain-containing protein n=1 Tax=Kitasatospora sp. NPDC048407 TaxID=3364051 RepID=UPI003711B917